MHAPTCRKCDAKAMRSEHGGGCMDSSFDAIVTNVPWGVQTGQCCPHRFFWLLYI